MRIWIDLLNPSHVLFFNSLYREFKNEDIVISARDRAETLDLIKSSELDAKIIGKDYTENIKKTLNTIWRTYQLSINIGDYDYSISFENAMSVASSLLKHKKSILLLDNDIKLDQQKIVFQDIETRIKSYADYLIFPKACEKKFKNYLHQKCKFFTYDGYKEDIYIAEFKPNYENIKQLNCENYIVVRPEALGSFYVSEKTSIVPDLIKAFNRENINVVYLPREKNDITYVNKLNVTIPNEVINGLDLCYFSDAVLTGSGTMGREAACLGIPSVSFFPGDHLLSVDQQLINENKIFHSRNPHEIVNYIIENRKKGMKTPNFQRSKKVRKELIEKLKTIIYDN